MSAKHQRLSKKHLRKEQHWPTSYHYASCRRLGWCILLFQDLKNKQKTKGDINPLDYDYDEDEDEDEDDINETEEDYETEDDAESEDDVK